MKEYHVSYSEPNPNWKSIPELDVDEENWGCPNPGVEVKFQIIWNESGITYHAVAKEKHVLARYDKPNSDVWRDSCLEFFFQPDENDPRYFNMECNPNGAIYCGIGTNMPDRIRIIAQEERRYFNIITNSTADGWELFVTIPVEFIRQCFPDYELRPHMVIYANCLKCGDDTPDPHYLSWNPYPIMEEYTFHDRRGFGMLILDE